MAEDDAHLQEPDGDSRPAPEITVGIACAPLLADPKSWIRRRVETIDMLAHEETHRRVSIDFALSSDQYRELTIDDGVVVPISVLTKERRRNFSLRDEGGRAIPVLGKEQNGDLAHFALLNTAYDALPQHPPLEVLEMLSADLRQVVMLPRDEALDTLAYLNRAAEAGDPVARPDRQRPRLPVAAVDVESELRPLRCPSADGTARRILKYSYSEDFTGSIRPASFWLRLRLWLRGVLWLPDRRLFVIECPGAGRAASFHLEITTAEELRFAEAFLFYEDIP